MKRTTQETERTSQAEPTGIARMTRALRHRNYRLFFAGQGLSLIGTWIQQVALSWLVFRLTQSPFYLGAVGFVSQLPSFLLMPFAGVLVDRWHRHRVLKVTQTLSMLQAGALAALVLTGHEEIGLLLALGAVLGVINAFDLPARQAFVVEIVEDRTDLPNAIALNSSLFNGARLVGPALAGLLLAAVGEGLCFLINSLSYLTVLVALIMMRVPETEPSVHVRNIFADLHEGVRYAFGFPPIRALILLLAIMSLAGMPYTVLLPVFATRILGGGPSTLGFLMTASGCGALLGALYLAARSSVLGLGRVIVVGAFLFGGGLVSFALSRSLWLSLALLFLSGLGMMIQNAGSNTILQTIVDEDKRGRVMSLYTTAFMGAMPFGSLLAGGLADRIGAPTTLVCFGLVCVVAAAAFATQVPRLREMVLPLYARIGIYPPPANRRPAR